MTSNETERAYDGGPADGCSCCAVDLERVSAGDGPTGRWMPESPAVDEELPRELRVLLGRLLGAEPVETVGDWVAEVRHRTGGGPVDLDDLCHAEVETAHRAAVDGETYHFLCPLDAVILAAVVDGPIDVRTESPDGAVIVARATGAGDLDVAPELAVFSFGVDRRVEPPEDGLPTPADVYASVCPYVRAFPHPDAYKEWASTVPAETVAMPFPAATEVAAALTRA